jgi:hypothetical protein
VTTKSSLPPGPLYASHSAVFCSWPQLSESSVHLYSDCLPTLDFSACRQGHGDSCAWASWCPQARLHLSCVSFVWEEKPAILFYCPGAQRAIETPERCKDT